MRQFDRILSEQRFRVTLLTAGAALILFGLLGVSVSEQWTTWIDEPILSCFRNRTDPHLLNGPLWFLPVTLAISSLGAGVVLTLVVTVASGFFLLGRRYRSCLVCVASALSGAGFLCLLKTGFNRPRPTIVPPLDLGATGLSFPSGHSMLSVIIYVTLSVLIAQYATHAGQRYWIVSLALIVALLVGLSRIILGVHYPTDVIGGWLIGGGLALCWWCAYKSLKEVPPYLNQRDRAAE